MNKLPFEKKHYEILIKREELGTFGTDPNERSVVDLLSYGIVNINKPKGPTSHQVSSYVQKILGIKKSGHSGTLDPAVTGCLPVALGKATKAIDVIITAGKEYVALMHLHNSLTNKELKSVFKKMTGKIKQLPPIKSAIKRQWRYRKVYYIDILEVEDQDVLFRIGCEAGTYIRKYIHDFGQISGAGAHMQQLVRTKAGPFNDSEWVTLQELSDAFFYYKEQNNDSLIRTYIKPIEIIVSSMPRIWISDSAISSILNGADLNIPGIVKLTEGIEPDQKVAIMSLKGELLAFGIAQITSKKIFEQEKGFAVKINKVLYYGKK